MQSSLQKLASASEALNEEQAGALLHQGVLPNCIFLDFFIEFSQSLDLLIVSALNALEDDICKSSKHALLWALRLATLFVDGCAPTFAYVPNYFLLPDNPSATEAGRGWDFLFENLR